MLKKSFFATEAALSAMTMFTPAGAKAEDLIKINASAIGRPPIFANTFADLGDDMGFWKTAGLDVTFRWFQRGDDTAKAVLTGDVMVGYTATQPALNLIASGAPVVAIAGMLNQDFFVGSSDPDVHGCSDLKGKTIASDGIGNSRYLYLQALLATCDIKISEITTINLANTALVKAAIAGQIKIGVYHVDELAQVEFKTGKPALHIATPDALEKALHYSLILTTRAALTANREALVRFLEGWILTQNVMASHEAGTRVAFATSAAKANGDDFQVALNAIKSYQAMNYWANNDGLDEGQIMSQLDKLVKAGTIKPEKKPTYDRIVDKTLYAEAMKRVQEKYGDITH
jgi:ABC-type nitrate/sulfonate/bicarbonate transport system substrate-binding protein